MLRQNRHLTNILYRLPAVYLYLANIFKILRAKPFQLKISYRYTLVRKASLQANDVKFVGFNLKTFFIANIAAIGVKTLALEIIAFILKAKAYAFGAKLTKNSRNSGPFLMAHQSTDADIAKSNGTLDSTPRRL